MRREIAVAIHLYHAISTFRVVDATFVGRRGADGPHIALLLFEIDVPVSVNPGFQVVGIQIDAFGVTFVDKAVAGGEYVVIEDIHRCSFLYLSQVVLQPSSHIIASISRSVVAAGHRGNNVVYAGYIERIIYGSVVFLEHLFAVFPFHQVVIANAVEHRYAHIIGIHQSYVSFHAFFVADVAGVDDESSLFVVGIGAQVGYPTFVILSVEYFAIGYL